MGDSLPILSAALNKEKLKDFKEESDEEIKQILDEINRLSDLNPHDAPVKFGEDLNTDDEVDKILEKAQLLAEQSKEKYAKDLDKSTTMTGNLTVLAKPLHLLSPQRHVADVKKTPEKNIHMPKKFIPTKSISKETLLLPKRKIRPQSAGIVETKATVPKHTKSPIKERFVPTKRKTRPVSANIAECSNKDSSKSPMRKEKIQQLNENIHKYDDANSKTDELLNALTAENSKLKNEISTLKNVLQNHEADNTDLNNKVAEHETLIMKLGREYDRCKDIIENIKDTEFKLKEQLDKEKRDKENLIAIIEEDKVITDDLKRQCQELDMALKRKHPDSVSALIVASKTNHMRDKKQILLEDKIERLESELSQKEESFRDVLQSLHSKFGDIKLKYESHIVDIERQLMEDRNKITDLRTKVNRANYKDACILAKPTIDTKFTQTTVRSDRAASASKATQNPTLILSKLKEDSYLVATIRGLQSEMEIKDRKLMKLSKEIEDVRKTCNLLKREKEVLLNVNSSTSLRCVVKTSKSMNTSLNKSVSEFESELANLKAERDHIANERDTLARYIRSNLS